MFYNICRAICMFAFRIWYKIEYTGKENVPNGGGYIIICNHLSNIDPIVIAGAVKEPIHYMALEDLPGGGGPIRPFERHLHIQHIYAVGPVEMLAAP